MNGEKDCNAFHARIEESLVRARGEENARRHEGEAASHLQELPESAGGGGEAVTLLDLVLVLGFLLLVAFGQIGLDAVSGALLVVALITMRVVKGERV